jgi:hypothetical protein
LQKKARILINAMIDCAKAGVKIELRYHENAVGNLALPGMRELHEGKLADVSPRK